MLAAQLTKLISIYLTKPFQVRRNVTERRLEFDLCEAAEDEVDGARSGVVVPLEVVEAASLRVISFLG